MTTAAATKTSPAITGATKLDHAAAGAIRKIAVRNHEGASYGRVSADVMAFLYEHADELCALVKTTLGKEMPRVVLSVEADDKRTLGCYHIGRDGLGLAYRINMNLLHMSRAKSEVLATLLHEIMHGFEATHGAPGKNNYHSKQFVEWCEELGIPTDHRGYYKGIKLASPFASYCRAHGLPLPVAKKEGEPAKGGNLPPLVPPKALPKPKGSKLLLWQCGCGTKIRSGRRDLDIRCNECLENFELRS